jgi:hypothetical protein
MDDLSYLIKPNTSTSTTEIRGFIDSNVITVEEGTKEVIPCDSSGNSDLKVIFDGTSRILCNFSIKLSRDDSEGYGEEKESDVGKRIHLKSVEGDKNIEYNFWAEDHLIGMYIYVYIYIYTNVYICIHIYIYIYIDM